MPKKHTALELAALAWWRSKRPVVYSRRTHINNPTVNCTTKAEERLARAAAKRLR